MKKQIALITAIGLVAVALVVVAFARRGVGSAVPADPPQPVATVDPLSGSLDLSDPKIDMTPASGDVSPAIDAQTALGAAWKRFPHPDATGVGASLVQLSDPSDLPAPTLAWLFTFDGSCVRGHGPEESPYLGACVPGATWYTTVDASTGTYIASFAQSDEAAYGVGSGA
jgi:hypothetical protein